MNEHPELLERLAPSPADEQKVRAGMRLLNAAWGANGKLIGEIA